MNAGLTHGLHGHLKWLSRQLLADTADDEFVVRLASIWGLTRIDPVASTGAATIEGVDTTVCPDGTIWVRGDGVEYTQDGDATIASGTASITLYASVSGVDGDAIDGVKLTIGTPVVGITATATVSGGGIADGADVESVEDLRARLLLRLRTPPKGGGTGDYIAWALEVAGVTRAWELPLGNGPGTVYLYFVRDDDVSLIPDAGEITTVQTYLDTKRPITAEVTALAPTNTPLAFTFSSITPSTQVVKDAIEAELEALLSDAYDPGEETTILISQINEAISLAAGETDHVLTSPIADIVVPVGTIRTLGTVTWP